MPLSTTLPNLDEARLQAIKDGIVANIATLDSICSRGALLPGGMVIAGLVMKGDVKNMPEVDDAPILICVVGGGEKDALDFEARTLYSGLPTDGFASDWHTNIFVYIHEDLFPAADSAWASIQAQAGQREELRSRICSFVRGIFNRATDVATNTGFKITLASRERATAPDFDVMKGFVQRGYKGEFEKVFAERKILYGAHLVHVGTIA